LNISPERRLLIFRLLMVVAVIAITIFIFSIRDQVEEYSQYGYPGIFLLSILGNATIILPAPAFAITFAAGAIFNPIGVALAAGAGSAIGELTGYMAGYSGRGVIEKVEIYKKLEGWTERYGGWTILALAVIPNPFFDLGGVAAGALRMPAPVFLAWAFVGKTIRMLAIAYAGSKSIDWIVEFLG
jgi:membrane protein YqaA with SNARE-associated domain